MRGKSFGPNVSLFAEPKPFDVHVNMNRDEFEKPWSNKDREYEVHLPVNKNINFSERERWGAVLPMRGSRKRRYNY